MSFILIVVVLHTYYFVFSAYLTISCGTCSEQLGRLYRATPCHLDEIREMFTIDIDCIES